MTRPVRVGSTVAEDIANQLKADEASLFWKHDLAAALTLLSRDGVWDSLPEHGGGRRLTVEGLSIGAFHLFVTRDELDPRPDALVVYAADIWPGPLDSSTPIGPGWNRSGALGYGSGYALSAGAARNRPGVTTTTYT